MKFLRKHIKKFLATIGIIGIASAAFIFIPDLPLGVVIPQKGNLLSNGKLEKGRMHFAELGNPMTEGITSEVSKQATKKGVNILGEDLEKRNEFGRFYKTDKPNEYVAEFISGNPSYYKDLNNNWWEVNYSSSTPEEFNLKKKVPKKITWQTIKKAIAATLTQYPDTGNPAATAVDEYMYRNDTTFAEAHDATNYESTDSAGYLFARCNSGCTTFDITRILTFFDTSSLGCGASISDATASFWSGEKGANTDGYTVTVYLSTHTSNTTTTTSDGSYSSVGTTAQSNTATAINSWTTLSYNAFPLNATGIANIQVTGVTKFALRTSGDVDNSAPTAANGYLNIRTAEDAGTDQDPKLVVTYTAGSCAAAGDSGEGIMFQIF